jgi:hypothetical protein
MMRRLFIIISLFATFTAVADERGEALLQRISRHYSAMGAYKVDFVLRASEGEQKGELMVVGNNSYMRIGDTEVYVADSLRYEVRTSTKEIIVDRADLYEKDLLNPMNGFSTIAADYNIEECEKDGARAVRLAPKQSGETIYVILAADGESIRKVQYSSGEHSAEMVLENCYKTSQTLPRFSKEGYKGFELIDFR